MVYSNEGWFWTGLSRDAYNSWFYRYFVGANQMNFIWSELN